MILLAGLLLSIGGFAVAQEDGQPFVHEGALPTFAQQPAGFVPVGWKSVAIKTGDLNGDRKADAVVLMRMTDPANIRPIESKY